MNSEEFVDIVDKVIVRDSIRIVQNILTTQRKKRPTEEEIERSDWYKQLEEYDKAMVLKVIKQSVWTGVFQFLCVLDGIVAIEGTDTDKGELTLYYEKEGKRVLLNDTKVLGLNELLKTPG